MKKSDESHKLDRYFHEIEEEIPQTDLLLCTGKGNFDKQYEFLKNHVSLSILPTRNPEALCFR